MQKPRLPIILKTKLMFGNPQQIKALRQFEADNLLYYGDGTKKDFSVHLEFNFSETVTVNAGSAREAENLARMAGEGGGLIVIGLIIVILGGIKIKKS